MYYDRVHLCEGQKWDLEREVRKRDYEVQEKVTKAATTANNGEEKESNRQKSHVSFDQFALAPAPPKIPPPPRAYTKQPRATPRLSLFALSLSLRFSALPLPPPSSPPLSLCTYVPLAIVAVLPFTMFFLAENRPPRGESPPGRETMGKVRARWKYDGGTTLLRRASLAIFL